MPAEPVDRGRALPHQVLTMVHQQLELPGGVVVGGDRQVGLAQHRPGHGQGIDRVGLAPRAGGAPLLGHQLHRHPHHLLPRVEKVGLQSGGQVSAVLDPPDQVFTEPLDGPADRLVVALAVRLGRQLGQLPAGVVDGDERVRALVDIGSNDNHGGCLLSPDQ
jgi:hypothetical protein